MKLSLEQIKKTYAFTLKNKVKSYELQIELVDHLANGIEKQWKEQPTIRFDDALEMEFQKFGNNGFKTIIKEHFKALEKRIIKVFLKYFLEYFKTSKFLIVLFSTIAVYILCISDFSFFKEYMSTFIFIIVFTCYPVFCVFIHENNVRSQTFNKKRFSFKKIVLQMISGILMTVLIPLSFYEWIIHLTKGFTTISNVEIGLFSFSFVILSISTYVFLVKLPKNINNDYQVVLSQ